MIRTIFLLVVIFLCTNLFGQTTITFKLNLQPLIEKNLFFPDDGESVYVRGSFNQWEGDDYKLIKDEKTDFYSGKYFIKANIGDTLEYKFVIKKADARNYWERNPNPRNPNYGNRRIVVSSENTVLPETIFSYDEYIKYPIIFSKEKLQEDYLQMRNTVEEKHPALYDYTYKEKLDSLFNYYYSRIDKSLEFSEFYKIVSSVLERIGCGHTKLWIPADFWNTAPQRFFPLKLYFNSDKVLVNGCYLSSCKIPRGSEIISINDKPMGEIINNLKSITSSDAFINAFKSKSVEKIFSPKYALYYGYPESFIIKYIPPGENEERKIELHSSEGRNIQMNPFRGNDLSLKLLNKNVAALLTINSFIYYDKPDVFKNFIDSSFLVIKNEKINNLIIDLRGNDGGDPFCSSYLLSYIEHEPIPYFAEPYGRYDSLAKPIPKAKNSFEGNIYTLIDGSCFSTTGHFCSLLKYQKIGKLIGTETGATYTCTGSVQYIDLKNTRLILGTARKQRYSAAVKNMDRTKGIMPDYFVKQSQDDIINNKDAQLEYAISLIGKDRID